MIAGQERYKIPDKSVMVFVDDAFIQTPSSNEKRISPELQKLNAMESFGSAILSNLIC